MAKKKAEATTITPESLAEAAEIYMERRGRDNVDVLAGDPWSCPDQDCINAWFFDGIQYNDARLVTLEALAVNSPGQGYTPRTYVAVHPPQQLTPRMGDFWYNPDNNSLSIFVSEWVPIYGSAGTNEDGKILTSTVQLTNPVTTFELEEPVNLTTQEGANQWFVDSLSRLDNRTIAELPALP